MENVKVINPENTEPLEIGETIILEIYEESKRTRKEVVKIGEDTKVIYGLYDLDKRTLMAEYHLKNGQLHREGAAALKNYTEDGVVFREMWYENGLLHRLDGPAHSRFLDETYVYQKEYYFHGKCYISKVKITLKDDKNDEDNLKWLELVKTLQA